MKTKLSYGIVYLPQWNRIIMPIAKKKVFEYFYFKEEQPTYTEAEKELWIVASAIAYHIKQFEEMWLCKIWKRGIIKWTLEDF